MSETTYHIKIKKEYASAILEDLQQVEAIEIVEDIPEWQQREVLKRLAAMKLDTSSTITEEAFFKSLED
jgi:Mg/Co/Ni transporter MgtE